IIRLIDFFVFMLYVLFSYLFFLNSAASSAIYTLSLHDALPISSLPTHVPHNDEPRMHPDTESKVEAFGLLQMGMQEAKGLHLAQIGRAQRLNSSHVAISYAVFCLKKKKERRIRAHEKLNVACQE